MLTGLGDGETGELHQLVDGVAAGGHEVVVEGGGGFCVEGLRSVSVGELRSLWVRALMLVAMMAVVGWGEGAVMLDEVMSRCYRRGDVVCLGSEGGELFYPGGYPGRTVPQGPTTSLIVS